MRDQQHTFAYSLYKKKAPIKVNNTVAKAWKNIFGDLSGRLDIDIPLRPEISSTKI